MTGHGAAVGPLVEEGLAPRRIRVLIVDDHDMFAQTLRRFLEAESEFDVVATAATGSEAAAKAERLSPDVVLLDFELPDADGATVAATIKTVRPEAKVIMLTGYTDDAVLVAAIEAGCSGFITKDKRADELVDAVRAAHSGEAVIAPDLLGRLLPQLHRGGPKEGANLSKRELEILGMLVDGRSTASIASELVISVATVRNHVQNLIRKLGVHSKLEAVAVATRVGLIRHDRRRVR